MNIFNTKLLEKMLDLSSARQRLISNNLANVDTPGYKAKSLLFEEELRASLSGSGLVMSKTSGKHMSGTGSVDGVGGRIEEDTSSMRSDGNTVNIDREMVSLSKNNLLFSAFSRLIGNKFTILENAIKEGRR